MMNPGKNGPALALAFLLTVLTAGCNEGGIVGTGDGGPDAGSLGNATASNPDEAYRYRHLPAFLGPVLPDALRGKSPLQRNLGDTEKLTRRIQLELLYLDAAFDAIQAFCQTAANSPGCAIDGSAIAPAYNGAIIRAEHALLEAVGAEQPPLAQALIEKTGAPLPLGAITLTVNDANVPFPERISIERKTAGGDRIQLIVDTAGDGETARLLYRREPGDGDEPVSQTTHLFSNRDRLTLRTVDQNANSARIFLLNLANEAGATIVQADERTADAVGYSHTSWDAQADVSGGFIRARQGNDPLISGNTTLTRLLLGSSGNIDARQTCQDDPAASLCGDDSSLWKTDVPNTETLPLTDSERFVSDQALEATRFEPALALSVADAQLESLITAPATTDAALLDAGCAATRLIAGGEFRTYCWQPETPSGGTLFQSTLDATGPTLNAP